MFKYYNYLPTINIRWLVFFYSFLRRKDEIMSKFVERVAKTLSEVQNDEGVENDAN